MMSLSATMFNIQFIVFFAILFIKIYNLMSLFINNKKIDTPIEDSQLESEVMPIFPYDVRIVWLLFIGAILTYGIGLNIMLINSEQMIFSTLFRFQSIIILLHVPIVIIETFMGLNKNISLNRRREGYDRFMATPRR